MAATLTLCTSRKMPSSVCLLLIPLALHCSMLNDLSDMVGVTKGVRGRGGVIQIQPLALRKSAAFRRTEHL